MGPIPDMGHVDALVALQNRVVKKFAKFIHCSSGLESKLVVIRGFQKGTTLWGRASGSF